MSPARCGSIGTIACSAAITRSKSRAARPAVMSSWSWSAVSRSGGAGSVVAVSAVIAGLPLLAAAQFLLPVLGADRVVGDAAVLGGVFEQRVPFCGEPVDVLQEVGEVGGGVGDEVTVGGWVDAGAQHPGDQRCEPAGPVDLDLAAVAVAALVDQHPGPG